MNIYSINKFWSKGFSMIEMLIVFSIMFLLIAVFVLPLAKDRQGRLLLESADDVFSILSTAHSNTLASINNEQYGVKIENDKVTMFVGDTYTQGAVGNKVVSLQNGVEIYSGLILLNGSATSIVFDRLTGGTNQYGTVTLRLKNDTSKTKTITIEKTGIIKIN